MPIATYLQAKTRVEALRATSFTAGANNGPWIDVRNAIGDLAFFYNVGAITGTVTFKIQDATDISGTGAADLSPSVTTAALGTAGLTGAITVDAQNTRGFVRLVGTVATGPALAAGVLAYQPKIV